MPAPLPFRTPPWRATPGAGNRLSPSRWTRCGLRPGCAATRPGFPRLRLGARGCASHFGTGVLGDTSHSATVYDLPVRALRLPPVRCRAAGAARSIAGCGWTPCPTRRVAPTVLFCSVSCHFQDARCLQHLARARDRTGWRQSVRGNVLRALRVALSCLCIRVRRLAG